MDRRMETTLASLGEAMQIAGGEQLSSIPVVFTHPAAVIDASLSQPTYLTWVRKETEFIKEDIPIYKLHRIFLI